MARQSAWTMSKLWRDDEEMAKKDDDHNTRRPTAPPWSAAVRAPRPSWLLRVVIYLFAACVIVFVIYNAAGLGYRHENDDDDSFTPLSSRSRDLPQVRIRPRPPGLESGFDDAAASQRQVKDGPIQHRELLVSIRALATAGNGLSRNRNILFIAAELQSATTLLPMACSMARELHSHVHFAFMGRSDISMQQLLKINGIDGSCPLLIHDARPDYAATSTEDRMTLAVERALIIFQRLVPPQVLLVDSTTAEESYLHQGTRAYAEKFQTTVIELPKNPGTRLSWITKLDSTALAAWNKVRFDIIVHSPRTGTGNLKRLLQSLARADLGGHHVPHLVVELPSVVEPSLQEFLGGFQWPPPRSGAAPAPSMLSLRHRILRPRLSEEESSVRLLESFWPLDPSLSHVLYLSPHVEIGPYFFHYVKYCLLFRRHSRVASRESLTSNVMAMSFTLPSTTPNGEQPFTPPRSDDEAATAFLWQAPTSDAVLFLGDKWVELHGYVSRVLEAQQTMTDPPPILANKQIGRQSPAWLEYALQLSRLRGYVTLYPSQETAKVIATAHSDLSHKPEEFGPSTAAEDRRRQGADGQLVEMASSQVDMLGALPDEGLQKPLEELPLLSWDGRLLDGAEALDKDATEVAMTFRRQVGHCSEADLEKDISADRHGRDLFCISQLGYSSK
ncbi:hypothetical protein L249_3702 [Ophiocordyceps polyrhachis-furcata BCC 54312]|uniref:Uncharacterized protein n=1 Tax=Ophiocordyceps polyrhachis-furcata BCC 54312 TaxID=1330021 RepID=A0A367L4M9_9HYPO|nr:hypothetical protein L249_3702 [Ophiocordyceps polyrhachis-furcata BCC 54312]